MVIDLFRRMDSVVFQRNAARDFDTVEFFEYQPGFTEITTG